MLPPLAELAALLLLWSAAIALAAHGRLLAHPALWTLAAGATALGLIGYVLGGLWVSGAPPAAYKALLRAPFYALWKFCLYAAGLRRRRQGPAEWVRTARVPLTPPHAGAPAPEGETS